MFIFCLPFCQATLGEADKEFNSIITLIHDCENFAKQYNVPGATINPYTNLTGNDVESKWNEVKTLVPQRDQTLQNELKKQQNNEALRRQFAEKANQVGPWIERQMEEVVAIEIGMQVLILSVPNQTVTKDVCHMALSGQPQGDAVSVERVREGCLRVQATS